MLRPWYHQYVSGMCFWVYEIARYLIACLRGIQMRAQNQQDLIYKRGQTGITKASVTIVFDNSDGNNIHPAFKDTPQITVTRQVGSTFFGLPTLLTQKVNRLHCQIFPNGYLMAIRPLNKIFLIYFRPLGSISTTPTSSSCKVVSQKFSTCDLQRSLV